MLERAEQVRIILNETRSGSVVQRREERKGRRVFMANVKKLDVGSATLDPTYRES